jgi:ankyrin repeat protein
MPHDDVPLSGDNHESALDLILLNPAKFNYYEVPDEHTADVVEPHEYIDIFAAAMEGDVTEVSRFLAEGVDVNSTNREGGTALIKAAEFRSAEVAKILIDAGANINAGTKYHYTALMYAIRNEDLKMIKLLTLSGAALEDDFTALMFASVSGKARAAKLLISAGININAKTQEGITALMFAARCGHTEVIMLLVGAGANVELQDNDGCTAALVASRNGKSDNYNEGAAEGEKIYVRKAMENLGQVAYQYNMTGVGGDILKTLPQDVLGGVLTPYLTMKDVKAIQREIRSEFPSVKERSIWIRGYYAMKNLLHDDGGDSGRVIS